MNDIERKTNRELLMAMNRIVLYMNDERAYEVWIYVVPDGADEDDFDEMAGDTHMMDAICSMFRDIVERYGYAGWFTNWSGCPPFASYGADEDEG